MKKIATIIILCLCCSVFNAMAQTDSLKVETTKGENVTTKTIDADSVTIAQIKAIYDRIENIIPRYKMYETANTYISLKLDTATGRVWMVQYGAGDTDAMVVAIDNSSLLYSDEDICPGRFEMYPTKNMYNFILLDTKWGHTYQVQWHTSVEKRMRVIIY